MPPKNLNKISKHITKKKGKNAVLHADSRDTKRLLRAGARDDKLYRLDIASKRSHRPYVNRVLHLQQAALTHPTPFTLAEMRTEIESWLSRTTPELASLRAARRANRPASTREQAVAQVAAHDEIEYAAGYWVPDMRDAGSLEKLRAWNGEWVALATMGWVRVSRRVEGEAEGDGVRASRFPPRGEA